MVKLFFIVALAIPAFAQMPQFLRRPSEANILPGEMREKMVIAEQKVGEARAKYQTWIQALPRPGYAGTVKQRHKEFLAARESALDAVLRAADGVQSLSRHSQGVVFSWVKEARKRLNRRQPDAPRPVFYERGLLGRILV